MFLGWSWRWEPALGWENSSCRRALLPRTSEDSRSHSAWSGSTAPGRWGDFAWDFLAKSLARQNCGPDSSAQMRNSAGSCNRPASYLQPVDIFHIKNTSLKKAFFIIHFVKNWNFSFFPPILLSFSIIVTFFSSPSLLFLAAPFNYLVLSFLFQ